MGRAASKSLYRRMGTFALRVWCMQVSCVCGLDLAPRTVPGVASQAAAAAAAAASPALSGPVFAKPLSTPDAVPEAGQQRALELMKSGALFRYTPGVLSETALAEEAICEYSGFKYSVGFNSCGSALFIALKCLGVTPEDSVLCNAFSFTAVPSAIHHTMATPVYVESNDEFVMDMDDLEKKITPDTKFLMLTHMRGKVADMQRAYEIADKYGLEVVEDCAHALGIQYDGVQLGRSSKVACFSTQSAKMINSGEGGFLCTDDPTIAAKAICYAGCYESLIGQHVIAPPKEIFDAVKFDTPNYSLRMSDLTACCVRPQIDTLEDRIEQYNNRYERITTQIADEPMFFVPAISDRVRPVSDSLQIHLRGLDAQGVQTFLDACKARGMPVGLFGSKDNARNFRNWRYNVMAEDVPKTEKMIAAAVDVRLPLSFDVEDIDQMGRVLLAAADDTRKAGPEFAA